VLEEEAVAIIEPPVAPAPELPPPPTEFPTLSLSGRRKITAPWFRSDWSPSPERFRATWCARPGGRGFVLGDFDISQADANMRGTERSEPHQARQLRPRNHGHPAVHGFEPVCRLPGPKSPQKGFRGSSGGGRMLNERLEGALQDDRGGPLTPMRIQAFGILWAGAKS